MAVTGTEEEEGFEPRAEGFAGLWRMDGDRDTEVAEVEDQHVGDNESLVGSARVVLAGDSGMRDEPRR